MLIKNIDIMCPINLKIFQNKFLKVIKINSNDTVDDIYNKMDSNLIM